MEKKETKMEISKITLDDLFSTQEQRDEAKLEKVVEVKISEIDDFPNHPFYNITDSIIKIINLCALFFSGIISSIVSITN